MASMARSERHLCHPWTTKAILRPPLFLQPWPDQFCGRTRETQMSQPLCKGVLMDAISRPKEAQDRQKYRSDWNIMFTGRPMGDHYAPILRPRRCLRLPLPRYSDLWATNLLDDLCANVLNKLITHWSNISASFVPPTLTWLVLWSHKGGTQFRCHYFLSVPVVIFTCVTSTTYVFSNKLLVHFPLCFPRESAEM